MQEKEDSSEIKLIKNGSDICTWNSKHIVVKCFWVTDHMKNGQVPYCPTKQMIADYMSKPLQGALFHLYRNVIMGWSHISSVFEGYVPPEKRVELDTSSTKS